MTYYADVFGASFGMMMGVGRVSLKSVWTFWGHAAVRAHGAEQINAMRTT